jgi:LmbE family N-acetylglucosaminyl deacetylase
MMTAPDSSTLLTRPPRRFLCVAAGILCLWAASGGRGRAAESGAATAILQQLRGFDELGSVLYIAAHPDDENTLLIAYLARGRLYRTAYLSLTRGDGGQNVLGPQLGSELGVIRTQELLAARRIDGGRQFFTRAIDFGFSKNYRETLRIWNRQEVLSDMVRVIREFRPDVLITRFSPQDMHTHGHHTASAVLAVEAFKLAGDPKAFPDQLKTLTPWQPKRILWNGWRFRGGPNNQTPILRMEISGTDPVTGESFDEIAGRSRSMHKTQGFGNFRGFRGGGTRTESFALLAGEPAANDILDGVDTNWTRFPGGAEIDRLTGEAIAKFDSQTPAASVPALLAIKRRLAALPSGPVVDEKRRQLDHILAECLGLSVTTTVPQAEVVAGETLPMRHTAIVRSDIVPVRWVAVRYPTIKAELAVGAELSANHPAVRESARVLPADTQLSRPYWLRAEPTTGMYRVANPALIGRPENPPVFPIQQVFQVDHQTLIVPDQPAQVVADPARGRTQRRLEVIPPVSLKLASAVDLFTPGATREVGVTVTSARPEASGMVRLDAPAGWKVTPATQPLQLAAVGERATFRFTVTAPDQPATARITAQAEVGGKRYDNERVVIDYPHIPRLLLQPPARLKAVCLHLAIRGHHVGYFPGAGDDVAAALKEMGYTVRTLALADLTPERLRGLDAVVVGIRAFDTHRELIARMPALFDYVKAGGDVVVQYNRVNGLLSTPLTLRISQQRVTDETAPVTFLAPDHPALNTPNKITAADFDGWVQERGVYFPSEWDEHFTPILACSDPGEAPLKSGLLVAHFGRGYFVYTGLDFFRELPAGVPGAFRLFANLVSLGK